MIERFFQSLENQGVEYLLISGQATVLYGAATFSEDIDLWIAPTETNRDSLLSVLADLGASYYKLTPPLELSYLLGGHGFHFSVPDEPEIYLDVMGKPPRVPSFAEAMTQAVVMDTDWGRIPTVGIKHLAALKTTRRLGDYPVIGQLVLRYLEMIDAPQAHDYQWAADHVYTVEDFEALLAAHPHVARAQSLPACAVRFAEALAESADMPEEAIRDDVEHWLTDRLLQARRADRAYWQDIIAELKYLRNAGALMPVGQSVRGG